MRFPSLLAIVISLASVASAQPAVATAPVGVAAKGQSITSADRVRLGSVVRVNGDGSVAIIFDTRLLILPASTLKVSDGKLSTSLSKREVASLP